MKDRGYITVFLTLMLSGIVMLFVALYTLADMRNAKGRAAAALRSAMSGVRAEYDRYIFDHYHVLLLDSNMDGEGTGKLEELIRERMQANLGDDYNVKDVVLYGTTGLMDDRLAEFTEQMKDASLYMAADHGVDYLKEKVNGGESPISSDSFREGDEASQDGLIDGDREPEEEDVEEGKEEDKEKEEKEKEEAPLSQLEEVEKNSELKKKDPRKKTRAIGMLSPATLLLPEGTELSEETLVPEELPSYGRTGIQAITMDLQFKSYDRLKRDTFQAEGWLDGLASAGAGLIYAGECFNCLTDEVQEDTVMKLEMEYLIAGGKTDLESFSGTINRILAIRLGCNLAYILTDAKKMALCMEIATAVCWIFPPAAPVVKYLIAGAWSYLEGVADTYRLTHGKKTPYLKTAATWITDIEGLANLEDALTGDDVENGLDYKDYLLILLAANMDTANYRMLDLMQCNANQDAGEHKLSMRDAVTAIGVSVDVEYQGSTFTLEEEIGY